MIKSNIKKIIFGLIVICISIFAIWNYKDAAIVNEPITVSTGGANGAFMIGGKSQQELGSAWYCITRSESAPSSVKRVEGSMEIWNDYAISANGEKIEFNDSDAYDMGNNRK